ISKEKAPAHYALDSSMLRQITVSQDDKLIAAIRGDEIAVIWDAATGKEVRRVEACSCVAFSPDGKLIAFGERGRAAGDANTGIIRLYERATGKLLRELRGHLTTISAMAFTPDSK